MLDIKISEKKFKQFKKQEIKKLKNAKNKIDKKIKRVKVSENTGRNVDFYSTRENHLTYIVTLIKHV